MLLDTLATFTRQISAKQKLLEERSQQVHRELSYLAEMYQYYAENPSDNPLPA